MRTKSRVRGVLLDVDGTLLDSNDAHALSFVETFREAGYDATFEKVRPLIGMGGDKLFPAAIGIEADSEEGERLGKRRWEIFRKEHLPKVRAFPGARALVDALRSRGLRLVVATSAKEDELRELLHAGGLEDLLEKKTSADDAERSKPDPDIVAAALKKGELRPAEAVMLGDTPYDVEAARRAGVATIALRCGGWGDDELKGADEIWDGPDELLANIDRSSITG